MRTRKDPKSAFRTLPDSVHETVDRRTWMNWVGKAVVVSLGGGLTARCKGNERGILDFNADTAATDVDRDSMGEGSRDAGADASTSLPDNCPVPSPNGIGFEPGTGTAGLFEDWRVRTVDTQNLSSILANWQLTVNGMVSSPKVFSFADILALPRQNQITDFHCVEGWSVYDIPWNGFHLSDVLRAVQPSAGASYVTFHTIDGKYNESLPIDAALEPKTMLAYGICESTLPLDRGFPLRLVVPRMLGYKGAKYVDRIEFTDVPIAGYWVALGYPYDAPVPQSRLREGRY